MDKTTGPYFRRFHYYFKWRSRSGCSLFTEEIVRKLNLILDGVSGGARSDFLEWKEQNKGKKGGKS